MLARLHYIFVVFLPTDGSSNYFRENQFERNIRFNSKYVQDVVVVVVVVVAINETMS